MFSYFYCLPHRFYFRRSNKSLENYLKQIIEKLKSLQRPTFEDINKKLIFYKRLRFDGTSSQIQEEQFQIQDSININTSIL